MFSLYNIRVKFSFEGKIMEKKIYKEANKGETETTINVLYKEIRGAFSTVKNNDNDIV